LKDLKKNEALETRDSLRESIMEFEKSLLEQPQLEMPVVHHFSKDLYGRELKIPEGTLLVGKIHKHKSLNILAEGDISLLTEEGVKRVQAPFVVVSQPGIKRIGYAHTDCTWITCHATKETDLDKIEDDVIAKVYDEVEALSERELNQLKESL
jgi:hypothetical protein